MPTGYELDPELRAAIVDDIQATAGSSDGSVRKIAARHGVSMGAVRRAAEAAGLGAAWRDGAWRTEAATAAKAVHLAERRAQLEVDLLDDIDELRERLLGDVAHLNVVKAEGPQAGEFVEKTRLPAGPRDWRDTMSAIAAASQQAVNLARLAAESGMSGRSAGLLEQFEISLRQARELREAAEQAPE